MTATEQLTAVSELQAKLGKKGMLAIYGGGWAPKQKGHGFWLYPASPEAIAHYNHKRGFTHLSDCGPCIQNDGKASGNPCFWLFADAERLVSQEKEVS